MEGYTAYEPRDKITALVKLLPHSVRQNPRRHLLVAMGSHLQSHTDKQKTRSIQKNWKKEKWESIEGLTLSDFKTYYRDTADETMCCWCKHRKIEPNREPRNTLTHACISDFQEKRPIKFNKKICSFKAVFLVQPDTHIWKENDLYIYILLYRKSNSNCTIALNVKPKLIKLISKTCAKSSLS